jgi:hypothetical protein
MEVSALKLYLKTKTGADATGEYDSASKKLTVKKGSLVPRMCTRRENSGAPTQC